MKNTLLLLTLIVSTLTCAQNSLITTINKTTSPKQEKYNPLAKPNTYQNTVLGIGPGYPALSVIADNYSFTPLAIDQ